MPSDEGLRILLDEHYPGWLADDLIADGIDAVALVAHRPELRGADDRRVLEAAGAEQRIVVTEDARTFARAADAVPEHVGIVYCHHRRFPRTRLGLTVLARSLRSLVADPPEGLGTDPIIWWLS